MSSKARLDRLEATVNRLLLEDLAREHGLTVQEIMEEVQAFQALSLVEQLSSVDEHASALTADGYDVEQFKAELRRMAGVPTRQAAPAKRTRVSRPVERRSP